MTAPQVCLPNKLHLQKTATGLKCTSENLKLGQVLGVDSGLWLLYCHILTQGAHRSHEANRHISCISTELYSVPCPSIYITPTIIKVENSLKEALLSFCCHPLNIFYSNLWFKPSIILWRAPHTSCIWVCSFSLSVFLPKGLSLGLRKEKASPPLGSLPPSLISSFQLQSNRQG